MANLTFSLNVQAIDAASLVEWRGRVDGDSFKPFRADDRILDPTRPVLVVCFGGSGDAPGVIQALSGLYPVDHAVSVVGFGGEPPSPTLWSGPIERLSDGLDRSIAGVYLPPIERLQDVAAFETLRYIVARLRAPNGCPWDREQTHQSMKKHFIEETYEAIAALDEDDWGKFAEELGDVLLQVVMHSQLGHEERRFDLEDVLRAVNEKLIRRHPHVFGNVQVGSSADVLRNWEKIKRTETGVTKSSFASIPQSMPALMRADAVQSRAARY
ncbi:MAG: nucleoside triphosphate pyrophosphohydrolase, partial [Chloroflexota bacterium]